MIAVIMQATWRCQKFRRMKYQPAEMKIVLMAFSEALTAGRSEVESTLQDCRVETLKS
jgi:hypothetical protein